MSESILNSSAATEILHYISESKEGNYASEMAREMDISRQRATKILKDLQQEGVVVEGKTARSKYYQLSPEGLADFWIDTVERYYDEDSPLIDPNLGWSYPALQGSKTQVKEFLKNFLPLLLQDYEPEVSRTLDEFLYDCTANSIRKYMMKREVDEGVENLLKVILDVVADYKGIQTSGASVAKAFYGDMDDSVAYVNHYSSNLLEK